MARTWEAYYDAWERAEAERYALEAEADAEEARAELRQGERPVEPCDLCGALAPVDGLAAGDPDAAHVCGDCSAEGPPAR